MMRHQLIPSVLLVGTLLFAVVIPASAADQLANQNASNSAKDITSDIATNWTLSKKVSPDTVNVRFRVYASGDNYNMAFKRVSGIVNGLTRNAKRWFTSADVQTQTGYASGNQAIIIVKISTKKINNIHKILGYVASHKYKYKTGIQVESIKFSASDKLKHRVQSALFRASLRKAKRTLAVINKEMGITKASDKYVVKLLQIGFGYSYSRPMRYNGMDKSINNAISSVSLVRPRISVAKGSLEIKANVRFVAERHILSKN